MTHLLMISGAVFGAFLAFAPQTPRAAEDRVCGSSDGGKFRWCIVLKEPDQCGSNNEWHCDLNGACWCGPAEADKKPHADAFGLPLVAREAQESGHACSSRTEGDLEIGDCGVAGWVCRVGWCQDSVGRSWRGRGTRG